MLKFFRHIRKKLIENLPAGQAGIIFENLPRRKATTWVNLSVGSLGFGLHCR